MKQGVNHASLVFSATGQPCHLALWVTCPYLLNAAHHTLSTLMGRRMPLSWKPSVLHCLCPSSSSSIHGPVTCHLAIAIALLEFPPPVLLLHIHPSFLKHQAHRVMSHHFLHSSLQCPPVGLRIQH
jgi:hypothetical protein